ncbi:MAG: hypothetical protein FWC70_05040 [Defluviitaleaceae bacterium]|nr:hypothetical protein [Defluviitaleaceae bacterium]
MYNPSVFVFFDEANDLNEIIARIQENEGGFNLNRVNICAVAREMFETVEFDAAHDAGRKIREAFCDEFSTVDLTLAIALTRESGASVRTFLDALTVASGIEKSPFDRIFIISDKNEHGEILPDSENRIRDIIAALPLLHETDFCDALAERTVEGPALASAGFWQKPPQPFLGNRELHRLADALERRLAEGSPFFDLPRNETGRKSPSSVVAVPAKPLRFWDLRGCTVKQAENLLFGGLAEKFFEMSFPPPIPETENYAAKLTLCEAATAEKKLPDVLVETEIAAAILEEKMHQTAAEIVRPWHSVCRVKEKIGEHYTLRRELQDVRAAHNKFALEHAALSAALDELRAAISRIKKLPVAEQFCETSDAEMLACTEKFAPVAISLLRDDGLLRESHIIRDAQGKTCVLRAIGGFAPRDLFFGRNRP